MSKGVYTQCECVLLERQVTDADIDRALSGFTIRGKKQAAESWVFGGPTWIIEFRSECNGAVIVDVVNHRWPDDMGDPKNNPILYSAWVMGSFGPFTYPEGLHRAAEQCWNWSSGKSVPKVHTGFVRIRCSYVIGGNDDAPVLPDGYDPIEELSFITDIANSLLNLPNAICYFNPNGEVLLDEHRVHERLNMAKANSLLPLDLWSNIRLFNIGVGWSLMDTVGNAQLDIVDMEACFHTDSYDLNDVDRFLRNISLYMLNHGEVIKDGDTTDGPGNTHWQARLNHSAISDPPREVVRWLPQDGRAIPDGLMN